MKLEGRIWERNVGSGASFFDLLIMGWVRGCDCAHANSGWLVVHSLSQTRSSLVTDMIDQSVLVFLSSLLEFSFVFTPTLVPLISICVYVFCNSFVFWWCNFGHDGESGNKLIEYYLAPSPPFSTVIYEF